ncbi:MAG: hypothetical protein NVS3B17_09020 [Vulcanimicrobiaceae bacterium]
MTRRPFRGLLALALVTTCAVGGVSEAASQSATGGTYVTSLPSGADIFFDGVYVGRSPLVVDGVVPGRHGLTMTKPGFVTLETAVTVEAGTLASASMRLAASPRGGSAESGTLVIRGLPAHATLRVDGTPVASPKDPVALPAGPHQLVVQSAHGRIARSISIFGATTTDVVLSEARVEDRPSGVVALAEDYLPTDAFVVEGTRVAVHYLGHTVVAHFGDPTVRLDGATVTFDSAPKSIGGKLYLPLSLLEKVTGDVSKSR